MSEFVWKEEYSIGHYMTDYEHKKLISLANKVIQFSNNDEDIDTIKKALNALGEYSIIHFRNEEDYMERIGYKDLEHHKKCHAELIARMKAATSL